MTDIPYLRLVPAAARRKPRSQGLAPDAELLLALASQLGARDLAALSQIVRRTAEICETDGEEVALAVLDQIEAIVRNRPTDA
jgi:hypothetical protein